MIRNNSRIGNFTSSEIAALIKRGRGKEEYFGAPALTYIEECNMERRLGRSLSDEVDSRATKWGKLVEPRVFELLGLEYQLTSTETILHPRIPYWGGSPDTITQLSVGDIKCPLTLKSFCQLVQPIYDGLQGVDAINAVRENHKDGDKYYWQLVSNAILTKKKYAELIVYMPYKSELEEIKQMIDGDPRGYFIAMAGEDELPYLIDGGYYNNLNIIRFEIPQEDIDLLTERVTEAGKKLIQSIAIASPIPEGIMIEPDYSLLKKIN